MQIQDLGSVLEWPATKRCIRSFQWLELWWEPLQTSATRDSEGNRERKWSFQGWKWLKSKEGFATSLQEARLPRSACSRLTEQLVPMYLSGSCWATRPNFRDVPMDWLQQSVLWWVRHEAMRPSRKEELEPDSSKPGRVYPALNWHGDDEDRGVEQGYSPIPTTSRIKVTTPRAERIWETRRFHCNGVNGFGADVLVAGFESSLFAELFLGGMMVLSATVLGYKWTDGNQGGRLESSTFKTVGCFQELKNRMTVTDSMEEGGWASEGFQEDEGQRMERKVQV